MAWGKAGSVTLDANDDVISLTGFTPSKFSTYLLHAVEGSGTLEPRFRLNNDTSGHSNRMARDGDADTTAPSRGDWVTSITDASDDNFNVGYLCNIDGKEKLGITRCTVNNGTSYTTNPRRREVYSKYTDSGSNAQITRFDNIDTDTSALKGIGSNLTLLGSDMTPASAIPFPTNVQVGSRAEITDSRKMFNFMDPDVTNQNIEWQSSSASSVTISGNTITRTGSDNWTDGIARSVQTISPSRGGGTLIATHSVSHAMVGLSKDPYWTSGNTYANGDYMMYHDNIYELGVLKDTFTAGDNNTLYKITMDSNGLVKYFVDNGSGYSEVYESTVTASGEYYVLGTPYGVGDTVSGNITGTIPNEWKEIGT